MDCLLTTARLLFRPFTQNDGQLIYSLNAVPEVTRYTMDPVNSLEQAEAILQNSILPQYRLYGLGRWAVHLKKSEEFIGWCGLKNRPERKEIDLGYRYLPRYWGKGYGLEAARASIAYGFSTLNLLVIIGRAMPENTGSWKILEKCGMEFLKEEVVEGYPARTYCIRNPLIRQSD